MKKIKTFWEANFLLLELILAVLISLCFALWSNLINHGTFISQLFSDSRGVLYGTLAALFGSLLGFAITAVSIILGYAANEKLEIVRKSAYYHVLWDTFNSAIKVLAAATVFALVGLVIDKDLHPVNIILYFNSFLTLLSFFRVARCIWILEYIVAIVSKKS
jgi:hypothetical protein